jgi:ferredoxin
VSVESTEPTLHIDWTRCDGHGTCADLLPEHITRDDWGFPVVHGPLTHTARRRAELAVDACPMLALRLIATRR